MAKQQKIIHLYQLYKKELQIYEKLKIQKVALMNKVILHSNTQKHG
jgi:hypothetical protein